MENDTSRDEWVKSLCTRCEMPPKRCACDKLTARAPDANNSDNMGYVSMGDGSYVKKPQFID